MTDSRETVRDKLGDPASWPSVPDDFYPPNESYLLAKLASVSCLAGDVFIIFETGGQHFSNTFSIGSDSEAELIVARIQRIRQKVHELLLEVINTELRS